MVSIKHFTLKCKPTSKELVAWMSLSLSFTASWACTVEHSLRSWRLSDMLYDTIRYERGEAFYRRGPTYNIHVCVFANLAEKAIRDQYTLRAGVDDRGCPWMMPSNSTLWRCVHSLITIGLTSIMNYIYSAGPTWSSRESRLRELRLAYSRTSITAYKGKSVHCPPITTGIVFQWR